MDMASFRRYLKTMTFNEELVRAESLMLTQPSGTGISLCSCGQCCMVSDVAVWLGAHSLEHTTLLLVPVAGSMCSACGTDCLQLACSAGK